MDTSPPPIEPDTRDWAVVIGAGCPECGFDAGYDVTTTGERLRATEAVWREQLARLDVRERPIPGTWSRWSTPPTAATSSA